MGITLSIIAHELEPIGDVLCRSTPLELFEDVRLLDDSADLQERDESLLFVCDDTDLAVEASARGTSVLYLAPTGEEDRSYRGEVCALFGGPPLLDTFSFLQRVFLKYRLWQNDLDRSCLADEGIQRLLDLSEQFLVNNVVVVDPALKLLAYTRGIECDDPITVELIAHGYHTEDNIRKFRLNKRFKPWATESGFIVNDTYEICKYVTVAHSFKTRDSFSLIAIMMCNNTAPADYLLDAFSMVLKRVSYYAKRDYPEGKPSGNVVDSFLRDLVEGRIKSEAAIRERCEFAGIPYNARFCLFSINASPEAAPVSRLASDVAREVAPAKTLIADREIIVLCFNCRSNACSAHCCSGSCSLGRKAISRRLDSLLDRYGMACGRSSTFDALANVREAYLQAHAAQRLGEAISARKPSLPHTPPTSTEEKPQLKHIFPFERYALNHLLGGCSETDRNLLRLTHGYRLLDRIADSDRRMRTDNYAFLYCYLVNERRASVVAEAMHMHRNNVKHRIDRIEKLFDIDASDDAVRRDLLFAYHLHDAFSVLDAH